MRHANKILESSDPVQFTSTSEVVEIREEDTKPGKPNEGYRKWLADKWGRKPVPPNEIQRKGKL